MEEADKVIQPESDDDSINTEVPQEEIIAGEELRYALVGLSNIVNRR